MPKLKKTVSEIPNKHKRICVLHVDKDPVFLELSSTILIDMDNQLDIDHACSVDEAFSKLQSKRYDVIVSGCEMCGKDGVQFLRELRKAKNQIPFILFTLKSKGELAATGFDFHSEQYICKEGNLEAIYRELLNGIVVSSCSNTSSSV